MNCRQINDLMGAYIYGDLPPEQMREVRTHTNECVRCRQDLSTRKAVVAAIGVQTPELTDIEKQRIEWFVKGAVSSQRQRPGIRRWMAPAFGGAAALTAGIIIAALIASGGTKPAATRPEKSLASGAAVKARQDRNVAPDAAGSADAAPSRNPQAHPPDAVSIAETVTKALGSAVRSGAGVAAANRGNSHTKRTIHRKAPEEVPTVEEDFKDEPQDKPLVFPEPAGPLDARTAPAEHDE